MLSESGPDVGSGVWFSVLFVAEVEDDVDASLLSLLVSVVVSMLSDGVLEGFGGSVVVVVG